MKIKYIICIILGLSVSCNAQKIESNMETYNFELMNNSKYDPMGIVRNGWKIIMYKMTNTDAYYNEYPPKPLFYRVSKLFYPNGRIKYTGKIVGEYLTIGESIYYDEDGSITRVDEDAKFGKIKLDDLLKFIEKEGWINLETGEGREDVEILEDGRCSYILSHFSISERKATDDTLYWLITIRAMPYNNFIRTTYHLDKDSGEVLYRHSEKIVYKK